MKRLRYNIEFFKWFEITVKVDDQKDSLNMIINKWYTISNKVVESVIPMLEEISLPVDGRVVTHHPLN